MERSKRKNQTKGKINKTWHLKHPMPKKPSLETRVAWHIQHAKYCGCREMPQTVKDYLKSMK